MVMQLLQVVELLQWFGQFKFNVSVGGGVS